MGEEGQPRGGAGVTGEGAAKLRAEQLLSWQLDALTGGLVGASQPLASGLGRDPSQSPGTHSAGCVHWSPSAGHRQAVAGARGCICQPPALCL